MVSLLILKNNDILSLNVDTWGGDLLELHRRRWFIWMIMRSSLIIVFVEKHAFLWDFCLPGMFCRVPAFCRIIKGKVGHFERKSWIFPETRLRFNVIFWYFMWFYVIVIEWLIYFLSDIDICIRKAICNWVHFSFSRGLYSTYDYDGSYVPEDPP